MEPSSPDINSDSATAEDETGGTPAGQDPELILPTPMPFAGKEGWYAAGSALLYLLFWQIVLRIHLSDIVTIAITTLISLLIALLFTVRMARTAVSPVALGINLGLSLLLILPIGLSLAIPAATQSGPLHTILPVYGRVYRAAPYLYGLLLMWFAASLGAGISRLVREMKLLLPMAVVLALVDLYVVFGGGLVTQAKTGSPTAQKAMSMLTVQLPTVRQQGVAAPIQLAVGVADFLFIAMFFACFARFHIPARRTFLVLCGILAAYMLIVFFRAIDLPALVPIAVVVIGMNVRRFRYERSEAFALLYAGLICLAVVGGFYFMSRQTKPPAREIQQH